MNKKLIGVIICILVTASLLASCQEKTGKDDNSGYKADTVRIQYYNASVGFSGAVWQLMMLNNTLENMMPEDVSVEWVDITTGPNARDALTAGKIDLGIMSETFVISAFENNLPMLFLANTVYQSAMVYSANENIKSLDDIKEGDKIHSVAFGNINHLSFMLACKEKYGDPDKFTNNIITMDYPELFASLSSSDNTIDCSIAGFTILKTLNEMENTFPILDLTPYMSQYNLGYTIVVNKDFYNDNPELIEIIYSAISETIDYMNEKPDEVASILSKYYNNMDPLDIEEMIKSAPPKMEISESAYNTVASLMYDVGMLSNPPKKFSEMPNYDRLPKTE